MLMLIKTQSHMSGLRPVKSFRSLNCFGSQDKKKIVFIYTNLQQNLQITQILCSDM